MAMLEPSNICNQHQHYSHSLPIFFKPSFDFGTGGLFLEPTIPDSFVRFISCRIPPTASSESNLHRRQRRRVPSVGCFLSVSLPSNTNLPVVGEHVSDKETAPDGVVLHTKVRARERGAVNTTKHLWAGAISAMVSRYILFNFISLQFLEYCNLN
jgi:solute carrier family 25 phosphate transporter 23/24/25/41